ncbi:MAG TPA: ABC transporter substrate-binding protein [Aggregatilineales bacterium]|nr:ABC transporter substrate-binding protein [Anaerolineales bacterium]HRE48190.1 ABC transporter substrate-binding protein [Aggregatilineales bacterium]
MAKLRIVLLVVILTALIGGTALPTPIRATQAGQTLTIGVIGAIDGPTLRGVSLLTEQANAAGLTLPNGTPYNLRVVAVDAGGAVQAAVDQLKQLGAIAIFGPDEDQLAADSSIILSVSGVPVFTGATSSIVRVGGFVQRSRANDSFRMNALADALISEARATRIAIYQGGAGAASATGALVAAFASRSISANVVLQDPARPVSEAIPVLLQSQPDTIAAFGTPEQLVELYNALRASGFIGNFATDRADDRAFLRGVKPDLRGGIYGVTGWTVAARTLVSNDFIQDYVAAFADVPDSLSAAAYDSASLLLQAINFAGSEPGALLAGLLRQPPFSGLQGTLNPSAGNGELTSGAYVIRTNVSGGPILVARYDNNQRQSLVAEVIPTATPFVPLATPTLALPPTAIPTATPAGVVATVISDRLNIRSGPGTNYNPPIGALQRGQQVQLFGASPDRLWYTINFGGQQGWISSDPNLVSIFGDLFSLPVVPVPPTPTPAATATPTLAPFADIVLVNASLSPYPLKSGQPFTLTATIRNAGGRDAGPFAIAAAFDPGGVFGATNLSGLAAGQQVTVNIPYAGVTGGGVFKIAIVLDLNLQVDEGPSGEANNKPEITYELQP